MIPAPDLSGAFPFPSRRPQSGPGSPQSWQGGRMYSRHRLRPSCGVFACPGHGQRGRGTWRRISAPRTTRVQASQRDLLLGLLSTTPCAFHALCVRSRASCDVMRRFALRCCNRGGREGSPAGQGKGAARIGPFSASIPGCFLFGFWVDLPLIRGQAPNAPHSRLIVAR